MGKSKLISRRLSALRSLPKRHTSDRDPQAANGQQISPTVFPEKKGKAKSSRQINKNSANEDPVKVTVQEHRIDIGDEKSNLLGFEVFSGKLILDKRNTSANAEGVAGATKQSAVDARLTSKALIWGSHVLILDDVVSVSYNSGVRYFTIHAYPVRRRWSLSCGLPCRISDRSRKDYRFLASSPEDAIAWVTGFSDHRCFVNLLPHPMKQGTDAIKTDPFFEYHIKSKNPPKVLVILNPQSGHGRSSKVFHDLVEPIFKLADFKMKVLKTDHAGHAKEIASTVDFSECPDGIICVGGDGIINEVLNGLMGRNDKEAISIPIGIIPAGSDNSLVWTILGVRDPISAAITIVKGGLTPTDVFAVEWIQNGAIHYGSTVTYFGFVSDVLELSEKYRNVGPIRYLVAGVLKFLCLPNYSFELEYLPILEEMPECERVLNEEDTKPADMSDLYRDILRRSKKEGLTRASSLSSIDSIRTPSRLSGDLETAGNTPASSEPSEYVRGLDPKIKRLSLGRHSALAEPEEVLQASSSMSTTPHWRRTRSRPRAEKGLIGTTVANDSRTSWGMTAMNDRDDISSTISDPGPVWDVEPKWDTEPNWETENPIQLPDPLEDVELGQEKDVPVKPEEKWITKKGKFLGIMICNHACRTVQSSQIVAPDVEHDDNSLELILVKGTGRWRLARFFVQLQLCKNHLSLPYVEHMKVKSVKVKPGKVCHKGCGIDGELLPVNGQVICSLLPEQCRLLGLPAAHPI